jgi:hypothetical protein
MQGKYDVIQVQMTKVVDRDCGLIPKMNGHGKEAGLVPLSKEEKRQEDQMTINLQVLQEQSLQPLKEDLSEWLAKTLSKYIVTVFVLNSFTYMYMYLPESQI